VALRAPFGPLPPTGLDLILTRVRNCIMSKLDLFSGAEGKKRLAAALKSHDVIGNHGALARKFAEQAEVEEFSSGQTLLKQNATDQDVYLIIEGEVSVEVNGKRVATSGPGAPIGEMAVLDPYGARSASVIAITDTVVAHIKHARFEALAKEYPQIWRAIAQELARHVRRHNARL
jgi:CRP/FNR family cyclic AMP-dependent transcriptional regulator